MPVMQHVVTWEDTAALFGMGVVDLEVIAHPTGDVLYAVTAAGGAALSFGLDENSPLQLLNQVALPAPATALPGGFTALAVPGAGVLGVVLGGYGAALSAYGLSPDGGFSGLSPLAESGAPLGNPVELVTQASGGQFYVYASYWDQAGISLFEVTETGTLAYITQTVSGQVGPGAGGITLATLQGAQADFLLVASAAENSLQSFRIEAGGGLEFVSQIGAVDGIGIAGPSALETVFLDGQPYVVMAAADSSSLSVFRLESDGQLQIVDHILDDLGTRFANTLVLEIVAFEDRVYVLSGGGDDGISLFQLLPGGRLLHLASRADTGQTSLENIGALAALSFQNSIQIFVGSETEPGVSQFDYMPGPLAPMQGGGPAADQLVGAALDDLLVGAAGDDFLSGLAGDDLLMDGAGADRLRGGSGADIFVLAADGDVDRILDFEIGVDQIDLSALWMFYDAAQLQVVATATGAVLTYRDEILRITTAAGTSLSYDDFQGLDLVPQWRPPLVFATDPPEPPEPPDPLPPEDLIGTEAADLLIGGLLPDRIFGLGGNDRLQGRGAGDFLWGGAGADRLRGGNGNDRLNGNDGNDRLNGGRHHDRLNGQMGADRLNGNRGNDILNGHQGNDLLNGGRHHDRLNGNRGNDILDGGPGADTFVFNRGQDVIVDFTDNVDTIELGAAALGIAGMSPGAVLNAYASVDNGNTVFDFGNGNTLQINNLGNMAPLLDDLIIL